MLEGFLMNTKVTHRALFLTLSQYTKMRDGKMNNPFFSHTSNCCCVTMTLYNQKGQYWNASFHLYLCKQSWWVPSYSACYVLWL